jgi:hypothetical protein
MDILPNVAAISAIPAVQTGKFSSTYMYSRRRWVVCAIGDIRCDSRTNSRKTGRSSAASLCPITDIEGE